MPHYELRFHLLDSIHGDAHYDQKRRAAKIEIEIEPMEQPLRHVGVKPPRSEPPWQMVQAMAR
jgi:hypothetical protein